MGSIAKPNIAVKLPTMRLDALSQTCTSVQIPPFPPGAQVRLHRCEQCARLDRILPPQRKIPLQGQPIQHPRRQETRPQQLWLPTALPDNQIPLSDRRDAFITGPTSSVAVICFPVDTANADHSHCEAEAAISVLDPSHKPELLLCPGRSDIPPLKELNIGKIACKVVLDGLEGLPLTVPLETT